MKELLIQIIDSSMKDYLRYCNTLKSPSLQRLMESIVDQERTQKNELERNGELILGKVTHDFLKKEIQACLQPLKLEDELSGLQEIMVRKEAMADLFEGLAKHINGAEGIIFFSLYSLNERKYAGLVRARLELENLI